MSTELDGKLIVIQITGQYRKTALNKLNYNHLSVKALVKIVFN